MQQMPENILTLKRRIDEADRSSDVVEVLDILGPLLVENSSQELYRLLIEAFQALRLHTSDHMTDGEHVIRTYLLDYLEKDSDGPAFQKSATRQLRECLEEWMAQYPERDFAVLRQHILNDLIRRFETRPSLALCWTFAYIGYRDQQIVNMLWKYALHDEGEGGETALVTLTALGVPPSERPRLLEVLHQKIQVHVTQPLLVALYRLADSTSFSVVRDTYFRSLAAPQTPVAYSEISFALTVLARIAETHDDEEELQDQIWKLIADQYDLNPQGVAYVVNLGGDIVSRCDSKHVVPIVLTWLGQATDEEKQQQRNPLLSYRLEECVRPRQVMSWQQVLIPTVVPILRQSACQDTQFVGRSATHEMHIKEAAWGILLRMGYAEALEWFEEAVSKETNPYLRGELCDLFACFRFEHLPNDVLVSLTERYDAKAADRTGKTSAEISVRLGAVKMAQSAASKQAFNALLECGLTFDGQPLLASVEALAEVACTLARSDENTFVVKQLVEIVIHHSMPASHLAAARALETLTREQELAPSLLNPLMNVLFAQQDLDPFLSSIILSTIALQQPLPDALFPHLKQWAQERDDELALQSFSILAERGWLLTEKVLLQRLGVDRNEGEGVLPPLLNRLDWRSHVIGLLYLKQPETFAQMVSELIQTLPWASVVQLFGKLQAFVSDYENRRLSHEIIIALIERVQQRQTRMLAELDLIRLIARLIPEELALEPWDHCWRNWLPDARAILADVLGTLDKLSPAAERQRVKLLQMLMSDGQYLVRRAAYRGLQRCSPSTLQQWCWTWAFSDERHLRLYAAEAVAWLLHEGEQEKYYETLFHLLAADPEPEVRQTVLRTWQERRKRLWAQMYLAHVTQVTQGNNEVLAAWAYAEALKRTGDDTTLQALRTVLSTHELPPHIRHWYQVILKETSEGWEKAMKKWPQPAKMWAGSLEVGHGVLLSLAGNSFSVRYTLWRDDPVSPSEAASWGGMLQGVIPPELLYDEHLSIQLEDGRRGSLLLKEMNGLEGACTFVGRDVFPH